MPVWPIRFQRHRRRSNRERASTRRFVLPVMEVISTARVRQPEDSILLRPTSPIPRRSPCSKRVISSGGSRRAASASQLKGCLGNQQCLAGKLSFPTNGSGKLSWASTMGRINRLGHGNEKAGLMPSVLADRAPSEGPRSTRAVEGNQTRLLGDGERWNL